MEPAYGVPVGLRAVGVVELAENALEIIFVVVGNVPEYGLEVTCAGRLVDGVDHLLKAVGYHFVERAVAFGQVYHFVCALVEVLAVFLCNEVSHVHEELRRGACAAEHTRHDEHHVDEPSAEGLEVGGTGGIAANAFCSFEQPGVHRYAGAVVCQAGLVVFVYEVVFEQVDVPVGQFFAVHFLYAVAQQASVKAYEVRLRQLAYERGYVFVFHVCVCVVLASGCGIGCVAVVD